MTKKNYTKADTDEGVTRWLITYQAIPHDRQVRELAILKQQLAGRRLLPAQRAIAVQFMAHIEGDSA